MLGMNEIGCCFNCLRTPYKTRPDPLAEEESSWSEKVLFAALK